MLGTIGCVRQLIKLGRKTFCEERQRNTTAKDDRLAGNYLGNISLGQIRPTLKSLLEKLPSIIICRRNYFACTICRPSRPCCLDGMSDTRSVRRTGSSWKLVEVGYSMETLGTYARVIRGLVWGKGCILKGPILAGRYRTGNQNVFNLPVKRAKCDVNCAL